MAKEEEKKELPVRTEALAIATPVGVTPRKCRLVVDLVRGKTLDQAYAILNTTNKAASPIVLKLIKSAESNAVNNFHMDRSLLYIASIQVNESFKLKRFLPRAKGSSSPIIKRWSSIRVVLKMKGATK
ncbi:MAG TPA: 50S ribosomal protein L22 [Firmicutes bacterium]|nr:50S ribosomal protein L22 [Bacillota bacterium]